MTKTERVEALLRQGFKTGEIYELMRGETTYASVSAIVCKYRRAHGLKAFGRKQLELSLERIDFDNLQAEAEKRKTTPEVLARKIISTIVNDDLFKAVLDQ
jgi:hypothetical protein